MSGSLIKYNASSSLSLNRPIKAILFTSWTSQLLILDKEENVEVPHWSSISSVKSWTSQLLILDKGENVEVSHRSPISSVKSWTRLLILDKGDVEVPHRSPISLVKSWTSRLLILEDVEALCRSSVSLVSS